MARIDAILKAVQAHGASDLHIATGAPPMIRVYGEMEPIPYQELTRELTEMLLFEIMGEQERRIFEKRKDVDFAYELPGRFRVRCNIYEERRGLAGAFRLLPASIRTLEQLGLPERIALLTELPKGLVVVAGPPGSGKSTTLAALIDHLNNRLRRHVITIEDPIEYVHESRNCLINQREVGAHTPSFAAALRAALREDPDTILVGEMRDYETIALALTAAQTGQLILGTLHTPSAAETVERIIDTFPPEKQHQAVGALASSLQAVVAQRLVRRADGRGRVAALEILLGTKAVSTLIRERKHHQIPSVIQTSRREGMCSFRDSLAELVRSGVITPEEAGGVPSGQRAPQRPPPGGHHGAARAPAGETGKAPPPQRDRVRAPAAPPGGAGERAAGGQRSRLGLPL